ncbi:MAG: hypothetical protein WC765_02955 [Phycisphaerae bacterium]|jgi:hypothetical protein
MSSPIISDASKSTQGIIHQFWVALEKCYEMGEGNCVLLEKEGDVAIPGVSTTEVKLYSYDDEVTDGHLNVWKTLRNWMDPNSRPEQYAALILRTNQSYGGRSRFKEWNEADLDSRVAILEAILEDSEARLRKESEKRSLAGKPLAQPSDSHTIQRSILEGAKRTRLREVVSKFVIAHESPGLSESYRRLKHDKCGHIPEANQDQYLGALLNVVIRPETIQKNWTIPKDVFVEALKSATSKFAQGNKRFPKLYRVDPNAPLTPDQEALRGHRFVVKICDIEHHDRIPQAIRDYHETQRIIFKDFRDHSVELPDYIDFACEVEELFELAYRNAQQEDPLNSKLFYDKTIREQSPHFSGFEPPPRAFRNGVIHMHMNNASKQHKWKLAH